MLENYCTNCGANLNNQEGFDPDDGYWTCTECGTMLIDPDLEGSDSNVAWFCDNCGAFLNKQSGFRDWYSSWTCTECGYYNSLSEDNIYESVESYQSSLSENEEEEYYEIEDQNDNNAFDYSGQKTNNQDTSQKIQQGNNHQEYNYQENVKQKGCLSGCFSFIIMILFVLGVLLLFMKIMSFTIDLLNTSIFGLLS